MNLLRLSKLMVKLLKDSSYQQDSQRIKKILRGDSLVQITMLNMICFQWNCK